MQFSSVALLLFGLAFSTQAETIDCIDTFKPAVINQYGFEIIGINDYFYETFMKPRIPIEEYPKECDKRVTKCLSGPDYLKCVDDKWVPAKCPFDVQTCRKGAMNNECS